MPSPAVPKPLSSAIKALVKGQYAPHVIIEAAPGEPRATRLTVFTGDVAVSATLPGDPPPRPLQFDGAPFAKGLGTGSTPLSFTPTHAVLGEGASRVPLLATHAGDDVLDAGKAFDEMHGSEPAHERETLRLSPGFLRAIERVQHAVVGEDNRYGLNLLRIEPFAPVDGFHPPRSSSAILLVSTDGDRLASCAVDHPPIEKACSIPGRVLPALLALGRASRHPSDGIDVGPQSVTARISLGEVSIRLVARVDRAERDRAFPDWRQVVPPPRAFATFYLPTAPLMEACAALGKRSNEHTRTVCFSPGEGALRLSIRTEGGEVDTTLPCGSDAAKAVAEWVEAQRAKVEGTPDLSTRRDATDEDHAEARAKALADIDEAAAGPLVAFNARYLVDVLDALDDAALELDVRGTPGAMLSPCTVREGDFAAILMPVRIN